MPDVWPTVGRGCGVVVGSCGNPLPICPHGELDQPSLRERREIERERLRLAPSLRPASGPRRDARNGLTYLPRMHA